MKRPADPDFAHLLADPQATLLAWIAAFFAANPAAQVTGMYIVTGRDFHTGGDATCYATGLSAQGFTEHNRNNQPLEGLNAYDELDTSQLLEVCAALHQAVLLEKEAEVKVL